MRLKAAVGLSLGVILLVGCGGQTRTRPERPEIEPVQVGPTKVGKADGFDWGSGCEDGSGTFNQNIAKDAVVTVGPIPKEMMNVTITLRSDEDVDIQLYDKSGTVVVGWPDGLLKGESEESVEYNGVRITWSGYNGDGTNLGHEFIKIEGVTKNELVMKAYGYAAGTAKIDYSWEANPDCESSGSGSFTQEIPHDGVVEVGEIPKNLQNVKIHLKSPVDIDIQLYHGDVKVVHWSEGLLKGPTKVTKSYQGVSITWSGYNGDGTGKGNEYIEIEGKTQCKFVMKVYGYEAGTATVNYSWGNDNGGGGYKPFDQRLQDFASKWPNYVIVATKQEKPAIFVDTKWCATEAKAKEFYGDLYEVAGSNTVMIWNPAEDNYFHLALGKGENTIVDPMFRNRGMRLYSCIHIWDISLGNMDTECYSDDDYDEDDYVDLVEDSCHDTYQIERERTVALIKLDNTQLTELNKYLTAIADDFEGTLGPADYYGGTPPYFGGTQHNCTSWFSNFLNRKVSTEFSTSANPASMLRSITRGNYQGKTAQAFRALLVFNHANPPANGATIDRDFPLEFGH